jgi:hypothetical protein
MGGEFGAVFFTATWLGILGLVVITLTVRAKLRSRSLRHVGYTRIAATLLMCCAATAFYSIVDGYNVAQWRQERGDGYTPYDSFSAAWQAESFITFGFSTQLMLLLLVTAGFPVYGWLYRTQRTRPIQVAAAFASFAMLVFGALVLYFELPALTRPQTLATWVARAANVLEFVAGVGSVAAVVGAIWAVQFREDQRAA